MAHEMAGGLEIVAARHFGALGGRQLVRRVSNPEAKLSKDLCQNHEDAKTRHTRHQGDCEKSS